MDPSTQLLSSLHQKFFIEIIENKLKIPQKEITFISAKLASATGKHDNFISDIYQLTIFFQTSGTEGHQEINVIMKISPNIANEIKQLSVFTRERLMYEDMIVSFEEIWKQNANVELKFAPECYKVAENPHEIIVLEDLRIQNYHMASKKHGLDLHQSKIVLSKLARFHAASAVQFIKHNKTINHCFDRAANHIKHPPDSPVITSMKTLHKKLIQVANILENSSKCATKIAQLPLDVLMDSYFNVAHPMKCGLRVLAHADLWINNILLKEDSDGSSADAKLIDFQMSFWASPNADLIYFLFTSVKDDVKVEKFNEILEFYYEELRSSLKVLKYEGCVPTVGELKEDFMKNRMFAIQLFLHVIPMTRNCSSKTLEIRDLFDGNLTDETLDSVFMDGNVLNVIGSWLPFMDERGFFDI